MSINHKEITPPFPLRSSVSPRSFSNKVLTWYDQAGRHDLPWQKKPTPYRVWISEIMLQQTQVNTVIPYYEKFMRRFPSLSSLANAPIDDVLQHWSGLGYYARARHLHQAAQYLKNVYLGRWPKTVAQLESLPGIGRSTAGAILSLSQNIPAPILDGNVKRVLARCFAIAGAPNNKETLNTLWNLAERYTPQQRCGAYNQAMMDLGATLCTRTKPACTRCPLQKICLAHQRNQETAFPEKKRARIKPEKETTLVIFKNAADELLLIKRPSTGIWGGLWSFPECARTDADRFCQAQFGIQAKSKIALTVIKHVFTHFTLKISPIILTLSKKPKKHIDSTHQVWYNLQDPLPGGIPAPVAKLIELIKTMPTT